MLCIPLTSPKSKHFESIQDYNNRNYRNIKYFRYHYIKQADYIALLEQIKIISIDRINDYYREVNNKIIILNEKEKQLIINKTIKYINLILKKQKVTKKIN